MGPSTRNLANRALAALAPLTLVGALGVFSLHAPAVRGQEKAAPDAQPAAPAPAVDAVQDPAQPADAQAHPDLDIHLETEGKADDVKFDFNPKAFSDVIAAIRQLRLEVVQLRRELAEARGDQPRFMERRLGYRQDAATGSNGERLRNGADNREERRDGRAEDRDARGDERAADRDARGDERAEDRDARQDDRGDGDRIEDRGDRREARGDNREDRRDDRQDDRQDRRDTDEPKPDQE